MMTSSSSGQEHDPSFTLYARGLGPRNRCSRDDVFLLAYSRKLSLKHELMAGHSP